MSAESVMAPNVSLSPDRRANLQFSMPKDKSGLERVRYGSKSGTTEYSEVHGKGGPRISRIGTNQKGRSSRPATDGIFIKKREAEEDHGFRGLLG